MKTKAPTIVNFHMTSLKFYRTIDPTEILLLWCIRAAENSFKFAPTAPINTRERKQQEQETVSHPECEWFESPAVSLSFNGNAEFMPRFSRWLQTGKVAENCDPWFALGAKASWSKITNGKENYRVSPRRNLEAIGAVGANLWPFSFSGSAAPLLWSAQPW